MRGDRKHGLPIANIVDGEGNIQYHILPERWVKITIMTLVLLLILCVILGLAILSNKFAIDKLEQQVQEAHPDANT